VGSPEDVAGADGFAWLSRRRQLSRLRRLGHTALAGYGLEGAQLTLQRYEHNATFQVDARDGPYLLRINRPGVHTPDTINEISVEQDRPGRLPEHPRRAPTNGPAPWTR
jgi:hypothetical protein